MHHAPGEIDHPLNIAADRLADLDPAFIARVREDLDAPGAHTPERIRAAVLALAGFGAVVPVTVEDIEMVDGSWFGGGQCSGRYVAFPLHPDAAPAMRDALEAGEPVTVLVPPVDFLPVPGSA